MRQLLISALLFTVIGCNLTETGSTSKGPRLSYTVALQGHRGLDWSKVRGDSGYHLTIMNVSVLDTSTNEQFAYGLLPDSIRIVSGVDTLVHFEHTFHASQCDVSLDAVGTISIGDSLITQPLVFHPSSGANALYLPRLDESASMPKSLDSVAWANVPVSGSYTIDCPDPRE